MVKVVYRVHVVYQNTPVEHTGAFLSEESFQNFAKEEIKRPVYKKIPFEIIQCTQITLKGEEHATSN